MTVDPGTLLRIGMLSIEGEYHNGIQRGKYRQRTDKNRQSQR